jgi:hypothetical protein
LKRSGKVNMPGITTRIFIIVAWLVSTSCLIYRDFLPRFLVGEPPNWKSLTSVANPDKPASWLIMVEDAPDRSRVVGRATTKKREVNSSGTMFGSMVKIDAKGLFANTPLAVAESTEFQFESETRISPQGLLQQFRAMVHVRELGEKPILIITGIPSANNKLEIRFQSSLSPLLNFRQILQVSPTEMIRGGLEPVDWLPGIRVGQRWKTTVLQPLTARPEELQSEVIAESRIFWNGNPTDAFIVEHKAGTYSAKTYVRNDGLVIRQQLPTPLVKMVLEREPENAIR